ncbi:cytochrome b [Roseicyclus mahoneyensis]|uniref:Cytochrome b561 n=1 Tax=Roseicyclus mahoneyensis TaxID=164332 RepID=A0A316GH87_9RHOB|nr:cytochrome b/b6 domain-containing protein [Roseicyclus mahoneyensis]PWK60433.1 cytochrome b561 [Roseicyclus mahoneyensis]
MAQPTGYTRAQIALHWITLVLVALQYILHDSMSVAWAALIDGRDVVFNPLVAQHVATGALVAVLTFVRLGLRLNHGAPPPPASEHAALKIVAQATHWGFYALLILMPVSGAVAWFNSVEGAAQAHNVLKIALLALIALHVVAALVHQFIFKTNLMARMTRPVA